MEKDRIKRIILDNQDNVFNRKIILRRLKINYEDIKKLRKVISIAGPRRSGKTCFLIQVTRELGLKKEEIVYIDFSEITAADFQRTDFERLLIAFYELFPDLVPFFFFDEIQEITGFEQGLQYLLNKGFTIFITGSSSRLSGKELSSILRGKTLNYTLYPLSFKEYLDFKQYPLRDVYSTKDQAYVMNLFEDYLTWGGFPEVVLSTDIETKKNLISSYIDIMLFRDIIERHKVKNIHIIQLLFYKLAKSFTKNISINKWYNDFKSMGFKISKDTLHLYTEYFEESQFIFFLRDYEGGLTSLKKVYLVDNGLYNRLRGFEYDKGKFFENLVFRDLLLRHNNIYYLKAHHGEVDFLAGSSAVQACYNVTDDNIAREIKGIRYSLALEEINKGIIVTYEDNRQKSSKSDIPIVSYLKFIT